MFRKKYNKYGVSSKHRRTVDNIVFASKKEADMYKQVKLLERSGKISDITLQPKFGIQDKFENEAGDKVRAITYVADFQFWDIEHDRWRVIDCKGYETPVFKLKKKLFEYRYPYVIESRI